MSAFRRILASIGIILLCILMVLGMLVVVVRSSRVQTAAAGVVAEQLSRALGAKVGVRTLDYKFPNRLLISGVLVEDQQTDTLLYLDTITARADLRKLLTSDTLCIRAIDLRGGYANVYRLPDSTLNYAFLLRAFRSDGPKQHKPLPFNIQIDDIALSELYVDYLQWNAYLPDAKLHLHTLSSSLVDAEIERLTLYTEHNGLPLDVNRLEARVVMSDSLITLPKLHIELPHSDLRLAHLAIHKSSIAEGNNQRASLEINSAQPNNPQSSLRADRESVANKESSIALLGTDLCLHIDDATLTPADLAALVPALRGMRQPWTFSAALDGRLDSLEATNLRLAYQGQPILAGDITALGLPSVDSLYLRAHIDDLNANRAILQDIISGATNRPVTLPDMLARLGRIHYRGTLEGRLSDLSLLGAFTTDLGSIRTDGHAVITLPRDTSSIAEGNNQSSSFAAHQSSIAAGNNQLSSAQSSIAAGNLSFRGTLSTRRFDLGRLLAVSDMGTVALSVNADGSLAADRPFAGKLSAAVEAFTFSDYTYRDIRLEGNLRGKSIEAAVTSSDANIAFAFSGSADLRPAQPVLDFALRLEHFRPGPLHLSEKYSRLDLALCADVSLTGANIDDIDGILRLDSIRIANADRSLFIPHCEVRAESESLSAANQSGLYNGPTITGLIKHTFTRPAVGIHSDSDDVASAQRSLTIFSPYLNGNLWGRFSYSTLTTSILRCIARYLPKAFDTERERRLLAARPDNDLEFYLYANRLNELTSILDLPLAVNEMTTVKGAISDHSGYIHLQAVAPDIVVAGQHIEDLTFNLNNAGDNLKLNLLALRHHASGTAGRHIGDMRLFLNAEAADNVLDAAFRWSNPDTVHNAGDLHLTTSLSRYDNRPLITAHIHPSTFFLADSLWNISDAHVIYSAADTAVQIDGFCLSSAHQSVYANGIISRNPADSIYAELRSVDLDYLLGALTNVHSALWFGGTVTGWATGYGLLREPMFEANVEMLHGAINGAELGNVYASAILDRQRKTVLIQGDVYDDRLPAVHVSIDDLPARRVFSAIPYPASATAFTPYKSGLPSFDQSSIAPGNNPSSIASGNNPQSSLRADRESVANKELSSHPASSRKGRHTVHLDGEVGGAPGRWGLDIYPDSVDLGFVNYWVGSFLSDLRGHATGTVRIRGGKQTDGRPFTTVSLAALPASDASFVLPFTGARYFVSDSILMDSTSIRFPDVTLRDVEGNPVAFRGTVTHDGRFNDIHVDLTAEPRSAIVLDIPDNPDEDFSGRVYANGIATVRGPVSDLAVTATATTAARSRFTLSLAGSSNAHTSDFITFVDHTPLHHQSSISPSGAQFGSADNQLTAAPKGAVTLSLQINVTPEATVSVLLDKRTGDRLQGRGEGDVRFTYVYPTGDMSLFGGLTLQQGTFDFTFQNVIRREFQIAEGSSVRWNGIPEDPQLDVRALYRVTASLRDLFGTEASSVTSRSNIPVSCVLNLSESLNSPLIRFGLEFPSSDESVASQVRSVINTDEMLTREVLYLLVFNRFYTPDYLSASQTNLGVNETYSLISSTVTGQINSWINKLTDKFSVGFNMRTDGEGANASQEYEAQFEIQPVRGLLINGNVGYRYNDIANQPYFGNLDVEYMLTPNGKLRAKAYTHTVDKYSLRQANTVQGVGFVFKHDFNWPAAERRLRRSQSLSPDTLPADSIRPQLSDTLSISE